MRLNFLPLLVLSLICIRTGFAQDTNPSRQGELDAVIKDLETNGYEAVKNKKLNLRTIQYVTGTSQLTPDYKKYLDTIAVFLTRVPTVIMEIGGHTDNTGGAAINKKLSQDRANSAMQYVITKGVLARRMKAFGYGSSQPIADNSTEAGRALNRRVEMKFLGLTSDVYNIVTKDGKRIPSTYLVISSDGKTVSYRQNASAPVTRIPTSGIDYIEYPDGSRRRPDVINLSGGSGESGTKDAVAEPARPVSDSGEEPIRGVGKWLSGKFPKINRWSVMGNAGIAPLTVKETNIDFAYVDESPSKDNLQTLINLEKASFGGVGQIGFEWETDKRWLTHAQFQFGRSSQAGLSGFVFGIGKSFGKRGQFITGVDLTLGSAYVKLGELVQNSKFIQVNGTRFDSKTVPIKFRNYFAALTPQIAYNVTLSDNLTLRFTGGYSYSLHTKSVLQFKGRDAENKKVKDKEKLSAPNVNFRIGETRVTDAKLFNLRGAYGTAGLLYHIYYRTNK